jgi:curved DNA-binding protein
MDYYSVLEVPKTATIDDIKKAYRKLAMRHHPDRNGGDDTQFKKIQEAYDTLSDPQKRQMYDNPAPQFSFNHDAVDINDIFSQIFGQRQNQKQTFRTQVTVSLVDAYKGSTHTLQMSTPTGTKVINITVNPGIETGDQIRYDNVIENAILLVRFVVLPDLRFERKGKDLYSERTISVLDLVVGTKFKFQTIDNRTLEVKVPSKTQPNSFLKIPKAGMPDRNGSFGDQFILIKGVIPDTINNEIIETIIKHQTTQ